MKTKKVAGVLGLLISMALAVPMVATAATPPAATYHGTWDRADVCGEKIASGDVTGVWNVNLKNDGTAVVSVRIFEYGSMHAAWGGNSVHSDFVQQDVDPQVDAFMVKASFAPGLPIDAIFTLDTQGTLTYELAGYCELFGETGRALLYGQLRDE